MPSTYSSNLKIELIANGEQDGTWGSTTNVNLGTALEEAITGTGTVTFASADVTLAFVSSNASQTFRNIRLVLVGTTAGTRNLVVPNIEKLYFIDNRTADTVTVKTTAGTGVAVPSNTKGIVYADGVNVVEGINHLNSPSFTGTPTAPTASPGTNTTQVATTAFVQAATSGLGTMSTQNANNVAITGGSISGATVNTASATITGGSISGITDLAVADGGTGASTFTANSIVLGNGTSALNGNMVAPGTNGNVLTSNGTTWTSAAPKVDQIVVASTTSIISVGASVIPLDNTKPQNTEGTEVLTATITPKSSSSTLVVTFNIGALVPTDGRTFTVALFQDSGVDAIYATPYVVFASQITGCGTFVFTKTSGTTSATTFKVRIGPNAAATAYLNAFSNGAGVYGGVCTTTLTVTEIVT